MNGGWGLLAFVIVVFHFVVPFLMLLSRDVKRSPRQLRQVANILMTMYVAHLYWMIVPAFEYRGPMNHVLNIAALAALCGGWLALFAWCANRRLVPGGLSKPQSA
jgi:hypothetical protein